MSKKLNLLVAERLRKYKIKNDRQRLNAGKEIVQELALLGLARTDFFNRASFHGGTALRIFYGLDRFSEDLDFCLQQPDPKFKLSSVLDPMCEEMRAWGLKVEAVDRSKADRGVQKAFLKESSLGSQLNLEVPLPKSQKFHIKLELDTNPPTGAQYADRLCDFPVDFFVLCHDLSSMFAGKLHALLYRGYPKGRDWYDFSMYLSRRAPVNLELLRNAITQSNSNVLLKDSKSVNLTWLKQAIIAKIDQADFNQLKIDVEPFIEDQRIIALWSKDYFMQKVENYYSSSQG